MNEVTIKGEIVFVDEVREYGANGFRKHQVVVETGDGKWANPIPVEFIKDSIEQSKGLKKGKKSQSKPELAVVNGRGRMASLNGSPPSAVLKSNLKAVPLLPKMQILLHSTPSTSTTMALKTMFLFE